MLIIDGLSFDLLIFLFAIVAAAAAWVVTDILANHLRSDDTEERRAIIRKFGNEKRNGRN